MLKQLILPALFCLLLSCESSETDVTDHLSTKREIEAKGNFVVDRRISVYSNPFAISGYREVTSPSKEYRFSIEALPSIVNGIEVNLHGSTFTAKNPDIGIFELSGKLYNEKRIIQLNQLSREIIYKVNEKEFIMNEDRFAELSNRDRLGFITLFSILLDRTEKDLTRFEDLLTRGAKKPVTYYAIGLGWSATSAGADVDSFNQNQETVLTMHGCVNTGRDISCFGTNHICIATDTWACDSNPGLLFN